MKRLFLSFAMAAPLLAEEAAGAHERDMTPWLWANFIILMGGLVYLFRKYGSPFFAARAEGIHKEITAAEKTQAEAAAKVALIDQKLAHLDTDLATLREENRRDQARESERLEVRHQAEIARIHQQAQAEIEAAAKTARLQLQREAARLALDLAERKVAARMNPEIQKKLASDFVDSLS